VAVILDALRTAARPQGATEPTGPRSP
jgi:hypothetical protein